MHKCVLQRHMDTQDPLQRLRTLKVTALNVSVLVTELRLVYTFVFRKL